MSFYFERKTKTNFLKEEKAFRKWRCIASYSDTTFKITVNEIKANGKKKERASKENHFLIKSRDCAY